MNLFCQDNTVSREQKNCQNYKRGKKVRLLQKLGTQGLHHDPQKLFETILKVLKDTSEIQCHNLSLQQEQKCDWIN